jgi:hypothetical protein
MIAYQSLDEVVAISLHDHKQAALYFDKILPCYTYNEVPKELRLDYTLLRDIYVQIAEEYCFPGKNDFESFEYDLLERKNLDINNPDDVWTLNDNILAAHVALTRLKIPSVPIFNNVDLGYERLLLYPETVERINELIDRTPSLPLNNGDALELTISDIGLVDTSNATWEQILELKKDRDARRNLRNFRLFLYGNFQGKSKAYISDSIDKKIDEYEMACKKHGFDMVSSSFLMLVDSKSLPVLSVIAAVGIISKKWDLTTAAIGTAIIETAKLSINLVKKSFEFRRLKNQHELAYIFDARKHLKKRKWHR